MNVKALFRKYFFRALVILIMLGTLAYFFIHLARQNPLGEVFGLFLQSAYGFLLLALAFMVISLFIKAFRFYVLVRPTSKGLSFKNFLIPFFVGYGFSTLGPLKSGEIVSVEINKRSVSIPRTSSLAAIVLFRILDLFIVLIFFIVALGITIPAIIQNDPSGAATIETVTKVIFYSALAGTIVLSFILFFPPVGEMFYKILKKIVGRFSSKGEHWLENTFHPAMQNYYSSLKNLYKQRIIAAYVVITTIIRWILEFYSLKFTLLAFGESLSLIDSASITSITLLAGIVTPAGLGVGTITTQSLMEGLLIDPAITGASIIYQTLVGTGLTLITAAITSIFLKDYKQKKDKKKEEETEETQNENEIKT
jgi:uncharacterized protein (TIRG00374 family)